MPKNPGHGSVKVNSAAIQIDILMPSRSETPPKARKDNIDKYNQNKCAISASCRNDLCQRQKRKCTTIKFSCIFVCVSERSKFN